MTEQQSVEITRVWDESSLEHIQFDFVRSVVSQAIDKGLEAMEDVTNPARLIVGEHAAQEYMDAMNIREEHWSTAHKVLAEVEASK